MSLQTRIRALESLGAGRVLVLSAAHLDLDLLPMLFDTLRASGHHDRLCVLLHCGGGEADAARRIALLLQAFTDRLVLLAPDRCEAAGTLLALAADEIVAGPAAGFMPIAPPLPVDGPEGPSAMSAQALRACWRDVGDALGLDEPVARAKALHLLAGHVFPTTLTAFHRHVRELERTAGALLSRHCADMPVDVRAAIVQALLHGDDASSLPLHADALRRLGLPVVDASTLGTPMQDALHALRESLGSGSANAGEDCDALIATADVVRRRRRHIEALAGSWELVA